jgi:heme/copper-type cytochrome/quinol oxidase subunit 1
VQFLSPEQYNELFTMHGTIMLFFFATPLFFGFANLIMPLHIGAPDVAFPRLNAFSYWLFAFGGLIGVAGFLTPGGAADFGWTAYAPFSDSTNTPGFGANLWIVGLAVSGLGTILGGVNFVATIVNLRAPGLTMFRMPVFTWSVLVNSILVLLVFPILTAALMALRIPIVAVADISRAIARNRPAVRVVRFPGGSATLSSPGERSVSPWRSDRLRGAVVVRSAPAGGAQRLMSHSRATSGGKRP